MDVIVGTAGHIDHGKTALVKALTGVDADRLPEEKQRGITIDLGFAEMRDGDVGIGFVDVPGHERFVKNMLAGASGIDVVMLVIAADEGVMPQTREHFDICRLLRIERGIIALTKTDLVDEETIELAKLDVAELVKGSFLESSPVFTVSARTGDGIAELKSGLIETAGAITRPAEIREARLSIDRSFSVKGFGAVVTGTLAAGAISEGEELELLPAGKKLRVRGIQTHGKTVTSAHAGQRTAINLGGIGYEDISRGMVVTQPGSLAVTQIIDTEVEILSDAPRGLRSRQRTRLHLGTVEVLARVAIVGESQSIEPGETGFAQFRLESPVVAVHGDRFVIRSYSPQRTIAGGRILDPLAHRHRRRDLANVLSNLDQLNDTGHDAERNLAEVFVRMSGSKGLRLDDLRSRTGLTTAVLKDMIGRATADRKIVDTGGVFISASAFDTLKASALAAVDRHHRSDKLSRGMQRETLREQVFGGTPPEVFRAVLQTLEADAKVTSENELVSLASHRTKLTPAEESFREHIRNMYFDAGLEVPKLDDALVRASDATGLDRASARKLFQILLNSGELIGVTNEFYFPKTVVDELAAKLKSFAGGQSDPTIDVSKFKEIAGVSRKYAIPLLEYFDRTRVTRRVGDKRQIL